MENRVKILIADGNEEFCDHVKRRLEQVPGYEIVGTAADGQRAAELMRVTKPDILVTGSDAVEAGRHRGPETGA
ncbi:MAG: hypothetical protein ACLU3I_02030 [Acutalibacteraceae bacterium]